MENERIIDVAPEKVEVINYVSLNQKIAMLFAMLLIIFTTYTISKMNIEQYTITPAIQKSFIKSNYTGYSTSNTPLKLGDFIPVKGYLSSSVDNTLTNLKNSINKTNIIMKKQQAINTIETALYKSNTGNGTFSKEESRELLLKAGFKPQKIETTTANIKKDNTKDGLELSQNIAKELIRDQVEGFMLKVKLVTQIGEYLFE